MTSAAHAITHVFHVGQAIGPAHVKCPTRPAGGSRSRASLAGGTLWATVALLALLVVGCGGDGKRGSADVSSVTDAAAVSDANPGNAEVAFADASLGDAAMFDDACLDPGQAVRCQLQGVAGVPDAISCSCQCVPLDAGATRLSCDPAAVPCCVWLPQYGICQCVNDILLQAFGDTCESYVGQYQAVPRCP
jgi:hypothetical protein